MYIGKVKYGDNTWPVGSTLYGTCDTVAGTAAKVVTMPDFDTLLEGVTIHVKFTHSNDAHVGNATLNVNNTGAKTIMRYGTTAAGTGASASWNAGAVVSFTYDGTYWQMNDWVNTDTDTTYSAGYGLTLSSTTFSLGYRWQAITKGQVYSRIMYATGANGLVGCSGILTVQCTRSNVVVNSTFLITTSHDKYGQLIQLSSNSYTATILRIVVNSTGYFYIDIKDEARNIAEGTEQTWYCAYIPISSQTVTTYTAFTSGAYLPDGFEAPSRINTTLGDNTVAIKNITRSGTTFTATRQNGTTFTFDQQDNNTTYTLSTGDSNGQIKVTPSSGSAYNVSVKGLGSNAYTSDTYLVRTSYDYHKEFSGFQYSYIEIGAFYMYDSMVAVDITLTTTKSWTGRLIISSQDINDSGGGTYECNIRGDNSLSLHSLFTIVRSGKYFRVYLDASGWKKVFCHIWCVGASASELFQSVNSIPQGNITINNPSGTFDGSVLASSFIKSDGTSSQFLKADGSVDSNSYVIKANSDYGVSKSIYSIDPCRIFTGQKYTDSPIALNKWVSGLALGSNWDSNHYQAYLVEGEDGRWYTTRQYENSLMKNWKTFAYLSDLPTKSSWNYDDRYVSSLTTSGNYLRWVKNGSNNDITIPYATSASKLYQTVALRSSGPSGKEKWYKFATLTFNTSAWLPFDHYLFFGSAEGSSNCPNGILRISGRAGNPSTTLVEMTLYWIVLNNTWYISKVKTVKTGDNVYDLYIQSKENYLSMVIYQMNLNNDSTLQFYTNNSWGNLPSNAVHTSVLGGTIKYSTQLLTARTFWGQSFDGTGNVNGDIWDASCLEFTGLGSSSGHGGYIDFHYNGSTADYTSRLIEDSSGNLNIYGNNLKVNGYPVFHSNHVLQNNGEDIVDDYGIGIVGCHDKLPANIVSDFASGNAYYNTPTGISPYSWGQVLNFFYHPDNCHFQLYVSDASSAIDMNHRYTGMFYRSGWASSGNPYYNRRPWRLILDNASIQTYYGLMLDQTSTHSILKMAYPKTSDFYDVLRYGGANSNSSDLLVGSDSRDTRIVGRDIHVDAGNHFNCIFVDNSSGSVGVGATSPSYKLHVNGACAASSFPNTSDIRLKDVYSDWSPNIEDIAYAPSFLFKWKDGKDKNMHAGTSAQYWQSKAPELVTEAKDDIGTLSIQYDVLGTLSSITLAKEILELKKEIKRLQAQIAEIKQLQK